MSKQVIIYGNGRSGSNILLDCLDLDPMTHCRNEPHAYKLSPIQQIIKPEDENLDAYMSQYWDNIVDWMSSRWGPRDRNHPEAPAKVYYQELVQKLGIPKLLIKHNRARRFLSFIYPEFDTLEEYRFPSFLFVRGWEEITIQVFKIITYLEANHLSWIWQNRPNVKTVHIVRYPLGFLQSLDQRLYKKKVDEQHFHVQNRLNLLNRLHNAAKVGLHFPLTDKEIESLSNLEVIIWNWLIFNESLYKLGEDKKQNLVVTYEQLLTNGKEVVKQVFEHCNLQWTEAQEKSVQKTFVTSAFKALSFQSYWSEEDKKLAESILSHSSIKHLWDDALWERLNLLAENQSKKEVSYSPY